jgi:hypothetical protein
MSGERPGREAPPSCSSGECRCTCGSLLARLVDDGVELKCRRCKRAVLLPLSGGAPPPLARRTRPVPLGEAG